MNEPCLGVEIQGQNETGDRTIRALRVFIGALLDYLGRSWWWTEGWCQFRPATPERWWQEVFL